MVIATDAGTWLRLRAGELAGLDAFRERTLCARGRIDLALAFEGMFRLPNGRDPIMRVHDVRLKGRRISTLTLGDGPDVVPIHGLGSAKTSFFDTAAALRHEGYRVHVIDLPGFGSSKGSATAPYSAPWFAETVIDWMDALGVDRTHVVGNSMGGRVALEVGLRAPERVGGSCCSVPPSRSSSAACIPSSACCGPSSACCPTASHGRWSPASSSRCSPTPTRWTRASPT